MYFCSHNWIYGDKPAASPILHTKHLLIMVAVCLFLVYHQPQSKDKLQIVLEIHQIK